MTVVDDASACPLSPPIEAVLRVLVDVSVEAIEAQHPRVVAALDAVREAIRREPAVLLGRGMASAPRDGFAFLATGTHTRDDPPGAQRGVKVGMRWWGIVLFDIWREPHRFVFAKDGQDLWSVPDLWCPLPDLIEDDLILSPVAQALGAAHDALRSYQHGNTSPDLAREVADHLLTFLGKV